VVAACRCGWPGQRSDKPSSALITTGWSQRRRALEQSTRLTVRPGWPGIRSGVRGPAPSWLVILA